MKQITDIKEMQSIELKILKKVHSFCVENNIEYFLAYGTLIGAVRHNGFIPWDDDIDIIMLRDQYEKFLELFPKHANSEGLFLASPHSSDHYYPHEYSKVCDSSTVLIERMSKVDSKLGVYIDVFPLDNMPNNKLLKKVFHMKSRLYRRLINAANTNFKTDDYTKHYSPFKQMLIKILHVVPIEWSLKRLTKMVDKYKNSNSTSVMQLESDSGAIYSKKWFKDKQLHLFENEQFFVPSQYDKFLKQLYGNYMELPPPDKQIPHHVIDVWHKDNTQL